MISETQSREWFGLYRDPNHFRSPVQQPIRLGSGEYGSARESDMMECALGCNVEKRTSRNLGTPWFDVRGFFPHVRIHHCNLQGEVFKELLPVVQSIKVAFADGDMESVEKLRNTARMINAQCQQANARDARAMASFRANEPNVAQVKQESTPMSNQIVNINGQSYIITEKGAIPIVGAPAPAAPAVQPQAAMVVPAPTGTVQSFNPFAPSAADIRAPAPQPEAAKKPSETVLLGRKNMPTATDPRFGWSLTQSKTGRFYLNIGTITSESGWVHELGGLKVQLKSLNRAEAEAECRARIVAIAGALQDALTSQSFK